MVKRCTRLLGTASILMLAACTTGPEATGRVTLSLATVNGASTSSPARVAPVTVSLGPDVLDISSVQLVARKLRLGRAPESCAPEGTEEGGVETTGESQGNCALLRLGPLLLDPPLSEEPETSFDAEVLVGTYRRIRLQLHMPDGSADVAFLTENPDLAGVSVRVEGTFNGTPFTFTTALTVEEEIALDEPLVVEEGATTSLTLVLDVMGWFVAEGGQTLIDPATTNVQLLSQIEQNIRTSFSAH